MSYLIDISVLSELRKGRRCHPGVAAWFESVSSEEIFLSVLVVGEVRRGIERIRRRDRHAARNLETWLKRLVAEHRDRILSVDETIAEEWGHLEVPDPTPVVDGLMAATARVHGLTLATRNVRDVARTGAACVNPFNQTG